MPGMRMWLSREISVERRGVVKIGEGKDRVGHTYQDRHRPLTGARSGWRGVGFGMSSGHEAYDAEFTAVTYGLPSSSSLGGERQEGTIRCSRTPRPPWQD